MRKGRELNGGQGICCRMRNRQKLRKLNEEGEEDSGSWMRKRLEKDRNLNEVGDEDSCRRVR